MRSVATVWREEALPDTKQGDIVVAGYDHDRAFEPLQILGCRQELLTPGTLCQIARDNHDVRVELPRMLEYSFGDLRNERRSEVKI